MKAAATAALLMLGCLSAQPAVAEPFVLTTSLTTSGWFQCRSSIPCSGGGTNSITLGADSNTATLTFTGVSTTVDVTNRARPVQLGSLQLVAGDDFAFPTNPINPRLPIAFFMMRVEHGSPQPGTSRRRWTLTPDGMGALLVRGGPQHFLLRIDPDVYDYTAIVYTVRGFPFTLRPDGTQPVRADVGVVPEPATMILLGTGLAGAALVRRRRRLG